MMSEPRLRRDRQERIGRRDGVRDHVGRMPAELRRDHVRLDRRRRRDEDHERVGAGRLQLRDLTPAGSARSRRTVRRRRSSTGAAAEAGLEPAQVVVAVVVVLVEDAELRVRRGSSRCTCRRSNPRPRSRAASRSSTGTRVVAVECRRAGRDEELRDLVVVQVLADRESAARCRVRRRARMHGPARRTCA